ncbi:MAG TPA: hypothetical protein VN721_10210 [Flavipsychrobacter sp.]|nr:hypothetical protein [Flavipsychrobacter sp.]
MTFELPLTEEKVKSHQITALHLVSALAFLGTGAIFYWLYTPVKKWGAALLIIGVLLLLVTIIKNKWLIKPYTNRIFRILELMIFLCLVSFLYLHHIWVATIMFGILSAAILFAIYWEGISGNSLKISVSADGIKLPITSRKRFIEWHEVEKILLKYGTFTVDCHNKRLFQWNIQGVNFDEEIFESFCNNQIEGNKSKRRNDDW